MIVIDNLQRWLAIAYILHADKKKKKPKFCKMPYACRYSSALPWPAKDLRYTFTLPDNSDLDILKSVIIDLPNPRLAIWFWKPLLNQDLQRDRGNRRDCSVLNLTKVNFFLGSCSSKVRVMVTIKMEFTLYVSFAFSFLLPSKWSIV